MLSDSRNVFFIHDACLLIDLFEGDLIRFWFASGRKFATTVLVVDEIKNPEQKTSLLTFVADGTLIAEDLEFEKVGTAAAWSEKNHVSLADASVALLARERDGILLSGDNRLRKRAKDDGVEVRGLFWIFDVLLSENHISPEVAVTALKRIRDAGARLPQNECENRLKKWSNQK